MNTNSGKNEEQVDKQAGADIESASESGRSLEKLLADIERRIGENLRLRRVIAGDGRLRVDRALPFLCVYRRPVNRSDVGTSELVTTEASYLFASGDAVDHSDLIEICRTVRDVSLQRFNGFLLLEIWSEDLSAQSTTSSALLHPAFKIVAPGDNRLKSTISRFEKSLSEINLSGTAATVTTISSKGISPPGLAPLQLGEDSKSVNYHYLGLAVHPVFRSADGNVLFPIVLQRMRRQLSVAIRKALFTFTDDVIDRPPGHYQSLGPTTMVKAVPLVDQQLCDISTSFDYLLQITPVNVEDAWKQFQGGGFRSAPLFFYRPLPRNPSQLKRQLFEVPIERIEDPTLAELFWEKQDELDRQISSLRDINTPQFLYGSLQLYGDVDAKLVNTAQTLLDKTGRGMDEADEEKDVQDEWVFCDVLAKRAQEEIAYYRSLDESFHAQVQQRNDIASGIMVSRDTVLISESVRVRRSRLEGLMHHEIGTHLLTYFNGRRQPIQQMFAGLAGYESFQEGIAVLSEYLVGGLTTSRIRTLAARVVAADMMVEGHSFVEVFEWLTDGINFAPRRAFTVATRIFRAGGSTKDAIYLRGLQEMLSWIGNCQRSGIEDLFVGKIAVSHLPAIAELTRREIVKPPALIPRYVQNELAQELLYQCANKSVVDLLLHSPYTD